MKRLQSLVLALGAFMMLSSSYAQPSPWVMVPKPPELQESLQSITFAADNLYGYAAGGSNTVAKTSDGGRTWFSLPNPPGPLVNFYGVHVIKNQPNLVWCVGRGAGTSGCIFSSSDGGQTWTQQTNPHAANVLSAVAEIGGKLWAVGATNEPNWTALVLSSTNNGQTWVNENFSSSYGGLFGISAQDDSHAWFTGYNGTIIETTNGGATWLNRSISVSNITVRTVHVNPGLIYAVGDLMSGEGGKLFTTTNGGTSWILDTQWGSEMIPMGLGVTNSTIYVAGGNFQTQGSAKIIARSVGTSTWTTVVNGDPFTMLYAGICQANDTLMWAAGSDFWYYQYQAPVNHPPHFMGSAPDSLAHVGVLYSITLRADDPDNDSLHFRPLSKPLFLEARNTVYSALFSGVPTVNDTGYHHIVMEVSDSRGGADTTSWWLHVVLTVPSQVVLMSPRQGALVTADSALCVWQQSVAEVTNYWFERSLDSAFTNPIVDSSLVDTAVMTRHLVTNTTYWWRVRAKNAAGWGQFSAPRSFGASFTGVRELTSEQPTEFALGQNYPNPFNPSTTIEFQIHERSFVTLTVYTLTGERVVELVNETLQPGTYRQEFTLLTSNGWRGSAPAASGVYIYRLQAGNYTATKKMLLIK